MKKLLIFVIVLGGLYYYGFYTKPGKQQFKEISKWVSGKMEQTVGKSNIVDETTTVYKVQNPDGSWSYTNEKPEKPGQVVEEKQYQSDANVLPSVSQEKPEK